MSGHAERLRRRAATLDRPDATRAVRLASRLRGGAPSRFDDLARVPIWRLHAADELPRIAMTAGVLHFRTRIDAELCGSRLAPIAAACGEALFDRACSVPPPPPEHCASADAVIPDAEALLILGRSFMERTNDVSARALVSQAAALVEEVRT